MSYGVPPAYGIPPTTTSNAQPDLSALLSAFQNPSQVQSQSPVNLPGVIPSHLLAALGQQTQSTQQPLNLASLLGQPGSNMNVPHGIQAQQPDMQEIMAQLAKYQR
jgi:hypothetical protein